jgi:hypothetical protein
MLLGVLDNVDGVHFKFFALFKKKSPKSQMWSLATKKKGQPPLFLLVFSFT